MAAPSIRGSTAPAATLNPTSPSSTAIGDLVCVFSWTRGGAGVPTHTLQAGFTEFAGNGITADIQHNDGSTDGRFSAAWKVATVAGANGYQAYTSSGGDVWSGIIVLTAGTYSTAAIRVAITNSTGTGAPNPASVLDLDPLLEYRAMACAAWHLASSLTTAVTPPASYTEEWEISGAATSELSLATRALAAGVINEDPGAFADDQTPNGTATLTIAVPETDPTSPTAKTFFMTSSALTIVTGAFPQEMSETSPGNPAMTSPNTGWIVGTGSTDYSEFEATTERASTTFAASPVAPDGSPNSSIGDVCRSTNPISGTFAAGDWTFVGVVRAVTAGANHDGRVAVRLLKNSGGEYVDFTELTSSRQVGTTVTNLGTTLPLASVVTVSLPAITLNNEYLFVQIGWERTGAGGGTTDDVIFRVGHAATRLITPSFAAPLSWLAEHPDRIDAAKGVASYGNSRVRN